MEGSASSLVLFVDVHFHLVEVVQSVGHVSLSSYVKHIESIEVFSMFVSTVFDQT